MYFLNTTTFIFLFKIVCVYSFTLSIKERPNIQRSLGLDIEDFQSLADSSKKSNINDHDIQVKTIRTYLIFGYIILLLIVIYVCYTTYKKSNKYKPMPCSN